MVTKSSFRFEFLWMQVIACILVIFGHSFPFETPYPLWLKNIGLFMHEFRQPAFVWISGFLLVYTGNLNSANKRRSFSGFAIKRFKKLLVPYFILSILALFPKYIMQPFLNDDLSLDGMSILRTFFVPRENVWGHFWFLPMIYLLGILGCFLDLCFKRSRCYSSLWFSVFIVSLCIFIFTYKNPLTGWFSIKDISMFLWAFSLGAWCSSLSLNKKFKPIKIRIAAGIMSLILAIIIYNFDFDGIYNKPIKNFFIVICMILFLYSMAFFLSKKLDLRRESIISQTFALFILSWPCQIIVEIVCEKILELPFYILIPLQFCAGILGPIIIIKLVKILESKYNNRLLSSLIGL